MIQRLVSECTVDFFSFFSFHRWASSRFLLTEQRSADLIYVALFDVDRQQVFKLSCLKNRFLLLSCIYNILFLFCSSRCGYLVFRLALAILLGFLLVFGGFVEFTICDLCGNASPLIVSGNFSSQKEN